MEILLAEPTHVTVETAFGIPELLVLEAWSEFHDMRMEIDLGRCLDGKALDETVIIYDQDTAHRWTLWRTAAGIVVQPMIGMGQQFATLTAALDAICPTGLEELSDLRPAQL